MDLQEHIHIGRIGKAQGIKGEVRVVIYSGMPDDLADCDELVLEDAKGNCKAVGIEKFRWQGKHLVAKLQGLSTRDDAEKLSGFEIWMKSTHVPALPDAQSYWFEYEGLEVVTDTGRELGVVQGVFATGANDVLVVSGRGEEYLIPLIEDVIVEMDKEAGKIIIAPLPGLLDMNS